MGVLYFSVTYQSPAVDLESVDLHLLPPIASLLPHLGRHVDLGPAERLQDGPFHQLAEAEVGELQDGVLVLAGKQQEVLRLEVPMADVPVVQVGDGRGHLLEEELGGGLVQHATLDHLVEELPALSQLQDQDQRLGGVDHLLQSDDVGVTH